MLKNVCVSRQFDHVLCRQSTPLAGISSQSDWCASANDAADDSLRSLVSQARGRYSPTSIQIGALRRQVGRYPRGRVGNVEQPTTRPFGVGNIFDVNAENLPPETCSLAISTAVVNSLRCQTHLSWAEHPLTPKGRKCPVQPINLAHRATAIPVEASSLSNCVLWLL